MFLQVVFSYLWEQLVPFTREFESIKTALSQVEDYSKTCLEPFLNGVSGLVIDEWGIVTATQVMLNCVTLYTPCKLCLWWIYCFHIVSPCLHPCVRACVRASVTFVSLMLCAFVRNVLFP